MHTSELLLINYGLNALWQAPLVLLGAMLATRIARSAGVRWQHRIWVAALLLEVTFPMLSLLRIPVLSWLTALLPASPQAPPINGVTVTSVIGITRHLPATVLSSRDIHALAFTYAFLIAIAVMRLSRHLAGTYKLIRQSRMLPGIHSTALPMRENSAYDLQVRIRVTAQITSPAVIGMFPGTILLPLRWRRNLAAEDVEAALAHEAAHIERHDFAKNLFYELLACPLLLHPAMWLTRQRLAETREMVCDEAAATTRENPHSYARSLLRLATATMEQRSPSTPHYGVGIFDAGILEKRIMQLTQTNLRPARRLFSAFTLATLLLATTASALALTFQIEGSTSVSGTEAQSQTSDASQDKIMHVGGSVKAPILIHSVDPQYSQEARKAKLSGDVIINTVIDTRGIPGHVRCVKDPGKGLCEKAVDAVRQYRFKPATQDGNPVPVDMMLKVNFQIF